MPYSSFVLERKKLFYNLDNIKKFCPNIIAMVKANAYGNGVKSVCKELKNKVKFFGVACIDEALEIRNFDKDTKILIVGVCKDYITAIKNDISITIENLDDFYELISFVEKNKNYLKNNQKTFYIHIKINSGMNRLGLSKISEFKKLLKIYFNCKVKKYINIQGVFTHFASKTMLNYQIKQFKKFLKEIPSLINPIIHIGGGIGKFAVKNFNNVFLRVGIDLYTLPRYIMHIESEIIKVFSIKAGSFVGYDNAYLASQNEKIAIIPLGYADGINRKVSGTYVVINNKNYQIVGNICMDMFFVRVDDNVKRGDVVKIYINSWDKLCNTINYEILTSFNHKRMKNIIV